MSRHQNLKYHPGDELVVTGRTSRLGDKFEKGQEVRVLDIEHYGTFHSTITEGVETVQCYAVCETRLDAKHVNDISHEHWAWAAERDLEPNAPTEEELAEVYASFGFSKEVKP